jgi:DNA-binding HxlR family transcriptional regulator
MLAVLAEGPRSLVELRRGIGSPPATTIRGYLRSLAAADIVEKRRHGGFPGSFDYQLTLAGRELKKVEEALVEWLAASPREQIPLGSVAAKRAIRILVGGWASGIVRALAPGPISLSGLAAAVPSLSYPAVERRVTSMRRLGLVHAGPGPGSSTLFVVADWLRLGVAPLGAALCWERKRPRDAVPLAADDLVAAFSLVLPALRPPGVGSGSARITVRWSVGDVISCTLEIESRPVAWAQGSPDAWIATILDRNLRDLELGGETRLAAALGDEMRKELGLA